jgi:hypothetical protein
VRKLNLKKDGAAAALKQHGAVGAPVLLKSTPTAAGDALIDHTKRIGNARANANARLDTARAVQQAHASKQLQGRIEAARAQQQSQLDKRTAVARAPASARGASKVADVRASYFARQAAKSGLRAERKPDVDLSSGRQTYQGGGSKRLNTGTWQRNAKWGR